MPKSLFVGNLPFKLSAEELKKIFEQNGFQVQDSRIILDQKTFRSKGYGFVDLRYLSQQEEAIKKLRGQEVEGRKIIIDYGTR